MKNVKDYIFTAKGVMTDALCDAILEEYKESDDWQITETPECQTIGLSLDSVIEKNFKTRIKLDKYVFASVGFAVKKYLEKFPLAKLHEQDSGYDLLRHKEGKCYLENINVSKNGHKAISCTFALNDNYEGGEFSFFNGELTYKLEKGSALIFPSNFMFPSKILPVSKFTKYSVMTWFI